MATQVVVNIAWKVRKNIRHHQNHTYNQKSSIKMEPVQVVTQAVENIANPIPALVLPWQRMEPVQVVIQAVVSIAWLIPMLDLLSQKVAHVPVDIQAVVSIV